MTTCLPRRNAATAIGSWEEPGVQMSMTSATSQSWSAEANGRSPCLAAKAWHDSIDFDVTPTISTGIPYTRRYPWRWNCAAKRAPTMPTRIGSDMLHSSSGLRKPTSFGLDDRPKEADSTTTTISTPSGGALDDVKAVATQFSENFFRLGGGLFGPGDRSQGFSVRAQLAVSH